ncbi:RraA family protein [Olivibacter sp. SDN3]|uniref:RraA family protein n=1 Tax=Olivibacter sp. SDN3 TaxID=2764720 RepID=UPI00165128E4|nr:RraA family protein [Olivibacter sp. SDN3]QNL50756.1 RraA family protein [Olivibacter sp. SDN3]
MKLPIIRLWLMMLLMALWTPQVLGQILDKTSILRLTKQWQGERFSDGRPRLSDSLLSRAAHVGLDDAWTILRNEGYAHQFEGNWKIIHPQQNMVGRALTAQFMPSRPDLESLVLETGENEGRKGNNNSWPIDVLVDGDIYVADGFGKIKGGTLIGQTLGKSIYGRSKNGVVFDAAVRDLEGLKEIDGFNAFVRGFDPSYLEDAVLYGINTAIRIGQATVLPGDLVLANEEGVLFIPAHLAEDVIVTAEFIQLRDAFGDEMIQTEQYTTGEIDNQWTETIKKRFVEWLRKHPEMPQIDKAQLDELMLKRTW